MSTAAKKAAERRKHQRLPLSIPVFVRGVDENGKEFLEFATALNISAGGILLATRRSLPKSAGLSLEIPVAPLPADAFSNQSVRSLKANWFELRTGKSTISWAAVHPPYPSVVFLNRNPKVNKFFSSVKVFSHMEVTFVHVMKRAMLRLAEPRLKSKAFH